MHGCKKTTRRNIPRPSHAAGARHGRKQPPTFPALAEMISLALSRAAPDSAGAHGGCRFMESSQREGYSRPRSREVRPCERSLGLSRRSPLAVADVVPCLDVGRLNQTKDGFCTGHSGPLPFATSCFLSACTGLQRHDVLLLLLLRSSSPHNVPTNSMVLANLDMERHISRETAGNRLPDMAPAASAPDPPIPPCSGQGGFRGAERLLAVLKASRSGCPRGDSTTVRGARQGHGSIDSESRRFWDNTRPCGPRNS